MSDEKGRFPGPYINSVKADDPIMKRVPMATLDIGARKSGLPKSPTADEATISHVGETASGRK
jgi:hypothetical protein